jgi:acyl dehydratase
MDWYMSGRYFEEFNVGDRFATVGRTVTEADVVNFAGISGDHNRIHTDRVFCEETPFGQPVAHGLLVLSIATGLISRLGLFDGTVIAMLGIDGWRFVKPVLFGDTVHVNMTIVEKRQTSHPERGVIRRRLELCNQRGEVVQEGFIATMCRCRHLTASGQAGPSART